MKATGTVGDAYWLDAASQLRGVKYSVSNATASYSGLSASLFSEWAYDAVGNRASQTGSSGITIYSVNDINQYTAVTGVSTIAYSTRGDLTTFGDWAFTYDAAGGLIRAHNTQSNVLAKYWRDASGHRAVKDVDGEKTLFFNLGSTQLEAYDVTTDMASSTIHEPGIDRPLAEVSSSGTLTFYHQDWLGNVAMLTNAAGAKVQTYTYDVWGKPSGFDALGAPVTPSSFTSRFLFTGREYDIESGLYHYRARAYSPVTGRFIQTDPIDFGGGDGNLFRYVANNPIIFIDCHGLFPTAPSGRMPGVPQPPQGAPGTAWPSVKPFVPHADDINDVICEVNDKIDSVNPIWTDPLTRLGIGLGQAIYGTTQIGAGIGIAVGGGGVPGAPLAGAALTAQGASGVVSGHGNMQNGASGSGFSRIPNLPQIP